MRMQAGSKIFELARGNHRACRLAGRRTAGRFQGNRKHRILQGKRRKSCRYGERHGTVRLQQAQRARLAVRWDQPEFGHAAVDVASEGRGHHGDVRAPGVDGGDEMVMAAAIDCRNERLTIADRAEIDDECKAGGSERADQAEPAPERETGPKFGSRSRLRGERCGDTAPNQRWRRNLVNFSGQGGEALFPRRDQARESGLACKPPLGVGPPGARQHAKRVFSGDQFVVVRSAMVVDVAHCSRQAFSLIMARRMVLLMVPSGTAMRVASSSYVLPSKKAARRAVLSR